MTKTTFMTMLRGRHAIGVLGYRKHVEHGAEGETTCHLFYANGKHVGTWISRTQFFFVSA